jgi:hypothetical protein
MRRVIVLFLVGLVFFVVAFLASQKLFALIAST